MPRPAYVIMMTADDLVPNWHQAISSHHADYRLWHNHIMQHAYRVTNFKQAMFKRWLGRQPASFSVICGFVFSQWKLGWVGLWGFLWWAPSAKGKDHHGVSFGWSSVWHRSNTGLSSTQYEQIPIILGVWPFWLTPFFFRSITFWRAYGLYFLCWNYSLSSGWHVIAA